MNENSINPWTTLSSREIYDNPWISISEHQVINPSGGKGIYGTVHFKNLALGILALDLDLNLILVGQYRFPIKQYCWEIPEGGGTINASPLEEAMRELMEETGLKAAIWEQLLVMHLSNSVSDEYSVIFLARQLSQFESSPEETEQLEIKKVHINEAYRMVNNGEISDSMSVAGILRLKLLLAERGELML